MSSVNIIEDYSGASSVAVINNVSPAGVGTHNLEATYGGDSNFTGSVSPTVAVQTTPDDGLATLIPAESWFGNPVIVSIQFWPVNGAIPTGTASCSGAGITSSPVALDFNGAAVVQMNGLPIGKDPIVCSFISNSPNFTNGASGPVIESVIPAPNNGTVSVAPSSATLYPGQTLQLSLIHI